MIILISLFGDIHTKQSRIFNIYHHASDALVHTVTSDFSHGNKQYKNYKESSEVSYIHVPAYKQNISLRRLYSHIVFAYKLKKYFRTLQVIPSTIYCTMPTSTAAYVCGKYCKKHKVKFVIDVIDLWPDSLFPIISGLRGKFLKLLTLPWQNITIKTYKMADIILGESKQYVNEAAIYNQKALVYPLYLGIDKNYANELITKSEQMLNKPNNEIWISYAGNLGTSYDFETLIKGVAALNGRYQYKLFFIGDGICRNKVESLIKQYSINAVITGFVEYSSLLKYLSYCDIAINIFRDNTKVVHSYKFNDYVATNCFILNSLEGETAQMIKEYQIGLNFDFKANTLEKVLLQSMNKWSFYKNWKKNNERLISEILDKRIIYSKIREILQN